MWYPFRGGSDLNIKIEIFFLSEMNYYESNSVEIMVQKKKHILELK